mmetsp:Transcript_31558/g.51265  ORF Transcript_31558/g.51265 Transcript_31558/m.51265 type:complete len:424 (+) Transcript_31558:163-1434(+)
MQHPLSSIGSRNMRVDASLRKRNCLLKACCIVMFASAAILGSYMNIPMRGDQAIQNRNLLGSASFLDWLCSCKGICTEPDNRQGISQHMPLSPSPPARSRLFPGPKIKRSASVYMKRMAEKAIDMYSKDLESMYEDFRRDINKERERSWELTVRQSTDSLKFESYRRVCPNDMGSVEYDQSTAYENATVQELEEFYRDDTHRATKDGSTESLEILAEDKKSNTIVIYQLVRYPWPLINREYVYVRRRFQDGDRFYYVMQAVNGREVLPDEEPDDDYKPRRLCTSVCAPCKSKQRVEDFVCLICFSPTKCRGASSSAAEWRQFGREHFGIHNAVVARAAKLAAAKSLWPFQTRVEQAFRSYTLKTNQAPKSTSSSSSSSSAPASEPSSPEQQRRGPLRPIANIFGWLTAPIRGGGKAKSKEDGD